MIEEDDVGKQILGHLKLYQDLGVRWARAVEPGRKPAAGIGRPRVPAAASAVSPKAEPNAEQTNGNVHAMKTAAPKDSLDAIRADVKNCRRCKLWSSRKNIVFGSGNPNADLMFVGEAPGADEDEQGLPFVGRAGHLLTKIIESVGLDRNDVFICNILKCRPPGNRNPEIDEMAACEQFLFRQIEAVKPKIIVALGAFGAQTLLRTTEQIGRMRGRLLEYRGVKLMPTYHPAYLLRNPIEKRKVWEDMLVVRKYLDSLRGK